ncbi:MAG: glycosyltransferase family 2 protein [Actinomycetota bacterium]|nr:glycosyltransferase family 2 protein [Actinomycetota bacterium]
MTVAAAPAAHLAGPDVDGDAAARLADDLGGRRLNPLTVIIAAYNEAEAIGSVLARMPAVVCGLEVDVLVVVDGGADGTAEVARMAGVLVCEVPVNRGQGAALGLGYRLAAVHGAQLIATLDADGQCDPAQLPQLVAPLVADSADFVTGSRRLGDSHTDDRVRASGIVVFAALVSVLTGQRITDPANGFRAMRAEVPVGLRLGQRQYQAAELLVGALLAGYRVTEVPTTVYPRVAGSGKKGSNLSYGAHFARVILATWWRDRRHRGDQRR